MLIFLIILGWILSIKIQYEKIAELVNTETFWVMMGVAVAICTLLLLAGQYNLTAEKEAELRFEESRPSVFIGYERVQESEKEISLLLVLRNIGKLPAFGIKFIVQEEENAGNHILLSRSPWIREGVPLLFPNEEIRYELSGKMNKWPRNARVSIEYTTTVGDKEIACKTHSYELNPNYLMGEHEVDVYLGTLFRLGKDPHMFNLPQRVRIGMEELESKGVEMTHDGWEKYSNTSKS